MGRQPCCDKIGLKRGPWAIDEDQKLISFILNNGIKCWRVVPKLAGLMRCGKSCRLRWTNYLRPDLKRGAFSEAEEDQIIELHSRLGNRWSKIASHFPGRTDNEIKNHWNTRIKKRLKLLGMDPVTHQPIKEPEQFDSTSDNLLQTNFSGADGSSEEVVVEATKQQNGMSLGSSEVEEMKSQAKTSSSSSNSFSIDDTLYSCMGGESCFEDSKLWVDTIDYFPSWEALYPLEDMLSFGSYP